MHSIIHAVELNTRRELESLMLHQLSQCVACLYKFLSLHRNKRIKPGRSVNELAPSEALTGIVARRSDPPVTAEMAQIPPNGHVFTKNEAALNRFRLKLKPFFKLPVAVAGISPDKIRCRLAGSEACLCEFICIRAENGACNRSRSGAVTTRTLPRPSCCAAVLQDMVVFESYRLVLPT
jgi:hypothetical protein